MNNLTDDEKIKYLTVLVDEISEDNNDLKESLSCNNEFFTGQLDRVMIINKKLKRKCDFMLFVIVIFSLVIVLL